MKRMGICFLLVTSLFINGCSNSTDLISGLTLGSSLGSGAGIATDTLIMGVDSTIKRIADYNLGESVLSSDGSAIMINGITSGRTRNLLLIKTEKGKAILIGGQQPIKSTIGWITVNDLQIGTSIECIDGQEKIEEISIRPYDGIIYNLLFEEESGIYGNGFIIGDYKMMMHMRQDKEK